jgi:hypothetical protein
VLVVSGGPAMAADAGGSLALAIKATYLYKLADFVRWPPAAVGPDAFNICIVGDDPFDGLLDRAIDGQTIDNEPIVGRRLNGPPFTLNCPILFVAGTAAKPAAAVLAAVRGHPVLTVTDGAVDQASHGIINFVLVDGHVRFEIDNVAAERNGLKISSKLLSLAVNVHSAQSDEDR